ncbi:hypothetical protein NO989_18095 [Alteromonas sp. DY56-G5]|jgi:hypothetical protein|uniref:Uncharacterized protein n=1 Tax=Alteromonas mediterranea TaxID=314275 RepID=A0AAC8XNV5_9ALTE|nr:hypothetical protein [Alteromonas mediterranea]AFV87623.1 hypothetical protein amad1_20918 [Alteromonas mediterranea DE1]AFV87807.1 hypothetical protein amad1_21868 [Alteromonas mediterranea DE1]AGP87660.1 hypothetical protein I607_19617 [Alteromonas mediterranea U4]AGP87849.1 hypothetical protein I607_20592 [Alteromonas mediterranea U4]AGP99642.1 hypothetical protein I635_20909 [Alteromonas mediterranea UM7]
MSKFTATINGFPLTPMSLSKDGKLIPCPDFKSAKQSTLKIMEISGCCLGLVFSDKQKARLRLPKAC